jgi:hypothetical protein
MPSGRIKFQKFNKGIVYLAVISLAGVLIMSYGIFNKFNPALYGGLGVTVTASYFGIFRFVILRRA